MISTLRSFAKPRTIQDAIHIAFSRMTLGIFLIVFLSEILHSLIRTVDEVSTHHSLLLRGLKSELRSSLNGSPLRIKEYLDQSIPLHPGLSCGVVRFQNTNIDNCSHHTRSKLRYIHAVESFHSPIAGTLEVYFDLAFLIPKIGKKIAIVLLPLTLTGLILLFSLRRMGRTLIQQLGVILNAINGGGLRDSHDGVTYSDLISFKRNLDDLLKIKQAHEEQISRLKIAKQLEHDIHSPLLILQTLLPKVRGISRKEKIALFSTLQRITAISKDIGRLSPPPTPCLTHREDLIPHRPMIGIKDSLEELILEKRIEFSDRNPIHLDFDPGLLRIGLYANPETFLRVISNLLNNAIEASPPKSSILVTVHMSEDQSLILSVTDQGKGIPKSDLKNLGIYGYTRGKPTGSGLGLFSAQEFLSSLGAHLEIDSTVDLGTTVSMRFPKECRALVL